MTKMYRDYRWKNGLPYGVDVIETESGYKIVSDPYRKRVALEEYREGQFIKVIYDSAFMDFRTLKPENQVAWQRIPVSETKSMIRDQDDRVILFEEYLIEDELCRGCSIRSPHGVLVGAQKIFYEHLGDSMNGVALFDSNEHPVMWKKYKIDEKMHQFSDLLEENWDIQSAQQNT